MRPGAINLFCGIMLISVDHTPCTATVTGSEQVASNFVFPGINATTSKVDVCTAVLSEGIPEGSTAWMLQLLTPV